MIRGLLTLKLDPLNLNILSYDHIDIRVSLFPITKSGEGFAFFYSSTSSFDVSCVSLASVQHVWRATKEPATSGNALLSTLLSQA